jgi:hypothetical protein
MRGSSLYAAARALALVAIVAMIGHKASTVA